MYKDTNKVLENITGHFQAVFGEKFEVNRQFRHADYKSENYQFRVNAAFIQARIKADFEVSIQQRIDETLNDISIEKGAMYELTTRFVDKPLSTEYCIELLE
jgi:hypothetical protein